MALFLPEVMFDADNERERTEAVTGRKAGRYCSASSAWRFEQAVISATASVPGRTYRIAVRGLRCRVLAMISCSGIPCSPRWVAAEWRSWCNCHPGVPGEQDPGAVVAEPGPSGGGARVLGCGAAGGAGAALGQEHRPGLAAADEAGQQVRGAGAPADPFGVAALGADRGAAGRPGRGLRCSAPAPRWPGRRRSRTASATGSSPAAERHGESAPGRSSGGVPRVALRCSRRRSALAGKIGAGSRLAAHQDSQAATAPRLRFQVAGARCPQSCSSRPASSLRRGQEGVGRGLDRAGVSFTQGHDFPGHLLLLSRCTG